MSQGLLTRTPRTGDIRAGPLAHLAGRGPLAASLRAEPPMPTPGVATRVAAGVASVRTLDAELEIGADLHGTRNCDAAGHCPGSQAYDSNRTTACCRRLGKASRAGGRGGCARNRPTELGASLDSMGSPAVADHNSTRAANPAH